MLTCGLAVVLTGAGKVFSAGADLEDARAGLATDRVWERLSAAIAAYGGANWLIIRPPAIYGPRDTEMFELFRIARWGLMPMPPREGRTSVIHVDDLARLLLA